MGLARRLLDRFPAPGNFFGRRLFNLALNVVEERLRRTTLSSRPLFVDVVITTRCNIRCVMCIKLDVAVAAITPDTFLSAARELFPNALEVFFCSGGENFLHPDFDDFLRVCNEYRIRTRVLTNGMALDRAAAEMVLRRRVDHLGISFDGATASTLASIRRGADFDTIVDNLRSLQRLKDERGRRRPRLYFMYTLMRRTLAELPAFVELAHELAVPRVQVNYLAWANEVAADELVFHHAEEARATFARAREVASRLGVELLLPPPVDEHVRPGVCRWPWRFAWIYPDGRVLPCYQLRGEESFGTLADGTPFPSIWNGPAYVALRRESRSGRPAFAQCDYCSSRCGFSRLENHFGPAKLAEFVASRPMSRPGRNHTRRSGSSSSRARSS